MINIEQFDLYNKNHWNLYDRLKNDKKVRKNVNSIFAINNLSYVISSNNSLIGMLKIIPEIDNFSIDIGILQEYTNNGFGSQALGNAIEIINFIDDDYNKVIIRTKYNNNSAIECSRKNGFIYDVEEIEKCINEGEEYLVLSKHNTKKKIKTMI